MGGIYRCGIAALLMLVWIGGSPARAETVLYKAELNAASHAPPNDSKGTASVTATYDTSTRILRWKGTHSGLTGDATMAHFHGPAEPGRYAGVAIWLSAKGTPLPASFEGRPH